MPFDSFFHRHKEGSLCLCFFSQPRQIKIAPSLSFLSQYFSSNMAAPMRNSMRFLVTISTFNKPCYLTQTVVYKSTARHVATTTLNLARAVQRQTNCEETNESTKKRKSETEPPSLTASGGGRDGGVFGPLSGELSVSERSDLRRRSDDNQRLQRLSDFDSKDEEKEVLGHKITYEKAKSDDKRIG